MALKFKRGMVLRAATALTINDKKIKPETRVVAMAKIPGGKVMVKVADPEQPKLEGMWFVEAVEAFHPVKRGRFAPGSMEKEDDRERTSQWVTDPSGHSHRVPTVFALPPGWKAGRGKYKKAS